MVYDSSAVNDEGGTERACKGGVVEGSHEYELRVQFQAALLHLPSTLRRDGVMFPLLEDADIEQLERLCRVSACLAARARLYSEYNGLRARFQEVIYTAVELYDSISNSVQRPLVDNVPVVEGLASGDRS